MIILHRKRDVTIETLRAIRERSKSEEKTGEDGTNRMNDKGEEQKERTRKWIFRLTCIQARLFLYTSST